MPETISLETAKVFCALCPHGCVIAEGRYGICGVRKNSRGTLDLPYGGLLSGTAMDPIEKKPLYHYYPGESILSVGFFGCNLKCPFCQNYQISQQVLNKPSRTHPDQLVNLAVQQGSFGIAYTYSEPLVHYEYVLESCHFARSKGLKNVLVTNGYINAKPAETLLQVVDAANVDLKSFREDFYKREIKGTLAPVLEFIRLAASTIHLEVTTLIIPGKNDSDAEMEQIAGFLGDIDPNIPLHLSCYYPTYKYTIEATPLDRVYNLIEVAKKHLRYVYPGNVGNQTIDTLCPQCSNLLISRNRYAVRIHDLKDGKCGKCGEMVPIVGV